MKLGFVLSNKTSYSETFLVSKFAILKNLGHEVIIFSNDNNNLSKIYNKNSKVSPISVFLIFFTFFKLFLFTPKRAFKFLYLEKSDEIPFKKRWKNLFINAKILSERLDYLHFSFLTTALRRENVALAISAKLTSSIRGYDISIYPLKFPNCYANLWSKVDKIHSISNALYSRAIEEGLSPEIPFSIINPAIDVKFFSSNSKVKASIDLKTKKINFLTVGRLHWKKGIEFTLEALCLLKEKKTVKFNYTIVGDGKEYERLIYAVEEFGLNKNVVFTGRLDRYQIKKYYKNTDIYLQYSLQEGFCNSVLEAQAMGLLVIASNAEGLEENIINEKTGWIVKKRNPKLLVEKIEKIINSDNSKLDLIRKNAVERVNEKFNINDQIKLFKKFYD